MPEGNSPLCKGEGKLIKPAYFGLDLAFPNNPSAAVALTENLKLAFWDFLGADDQVLQAIVNGQPWLVAIDAPLGLPPGLCCLEETCPCSPLAEIRKAERELAQLGMGCFYTTKRSIIKPLVYRGIELKGKLRQQGYEVVEVYPYASKVRLWGKPLYKKTTLEGLRWLQEKLARLLPTLPQGFDHHLIDATLAAYTAYLHHRGQSQLLGDEEEGEIVIPALVDDSRSDLYNRRAKMEKETW